MDEIVSKIGLTNNCTFCGVFRRQALDRGAQILKAKKIITGHNADDIAETVLMNILRGDFFRLGKSVDIKTGDSGEEDGMTRCKPFKYTYEKEIVLYAYHKKLDYFSTECKYSPNAYRGYVRELIKDLEVIRPSTVIDIIHSGEKMAINTVQAKMPQKRKCTRCGFIASNALCKACVLLESLGKPKINLVLEEK
jgi:cytoplasmic tRNA 2-thiolation protein 1